MATQTNCVVFCSVNHLQAGMQGPGRELCVCVPLVPCPCMQACKDTLIQDQAEKFELMCPNICSDDGTHPALVNAPYYGLWFVNKALRNSHNVTLLGVSERHAYMLHSIYVAPVRCTAIMLAWLLISGGTGTLQRKQS